MCAMSQYLWHTDLVSCLTSAIVSHLTTLLLVVNIAA
jgi:hypothetical protein